MHNLQLSEDQEMIVDTVRKFVADAVAANAQTLDEHRTLLSGAMRTATTDENARRWFRRYWTFGVGSGAHILVNGLLDVTREAAEARAGVFHE